MKAIQCPATGDAGVMKMVDIPVPRPGTGQVLVKIAYSGVNFIDVYFRTGLYKSDLPVALGMEAAGSVEAVGPDVHGIAPGDRVAYTMSRGSYAEYAVVPAWQLAKLPDSLSFESAAGIMLQGMTAHYLTRSVYALKKGDIALVHAAAGGAGLMIVQIAKAEGARVIGTVSTQAKADQARAAGADEIILYTEQDFEVETKRLTGGRGVDVVYDSVGKTTFLKSLNCLRPRGMMALFGQSSGPVEPFDPNLLNPKGSLFLTRPTLGHYAATREEILWRATDLFHMLGDGRIKLHIENIYPLENAADAHRDLESRKTVGKLLMKI